VKNPARFSRNAGTAPLALGLSREADNCPPQPKREEIIMLKWALICAIIALIAGGLGFFGIAGAAAGIAKFLFFAFLVLFVIMLIAGLAAGKKVRNTLRR